MRGENVKLLEEAYAKINLTLDVTGRRPDGYHEIASVMNTISICDTVELSRSEDGIRLEVIFEEGEERGFSQVPADERNIAYRAARAILEDAKGRGADGSKESGDCRVSLSENAGVTIRLTKRIPAAAGLAGGSTDAAAVLRGINRLYDLGYTKEQLCEIGAKLGADIPFCIVGGTVLCEGIGEKLTGLPSPREMYILLAKPPINVSTPEAYHDFDGLSREEIPEVDTEGMIGALRRGEEITPYLSNVLAVVTERRHPLIVKLREAMVGAGAAAAMMSGSGPSVFGLFDTREKAKAALDRLKKDYPDVYVTDAGLYEYPA